MAFDAEGFLQDAEKIKNGISPKQDTDNSAVVAENATVDTDKKGFLDRPLYETISEMFNPSAEDRQKMYDDALAETQQIDINPDENEENPGVDAGLAAKNEQARADFVQYVEEKAADATSMDIFRDLHASGIYHRYIMTDEERFNKAREISRETGLTTDAILEDDTTWKNAMALYDYTKKTQAAMGKDKRLDFNKVLQQFPELMNIADMDDDQMVMALHDMSNIRELHNLFDDNKTLWRQYKDYADAVLERGKYEYGQRREWYKVAEMKDAAAAFDKGEALSIEAQKNPALIAPNIFNDPLKAVIYGVGTSMPQQLHDMIEGGGIGAVLGGVAGLTIGAATVAVAGTAGVPISMGAGAFIGATTFIGAREGFWQGNFNAMAKDMEGEHYQQLFENRNANGRDAIHNHSFTHAEMQENARVTGAANAFWEVADQRMFMNIVTPGKKQAEKGFLESLEKLNNKIAREQAIDKAASEASKKVGKAAGRKAADEAAKETIVKESALDFAKEELPTIAKVPIASSVGEGMDEALQSATSDLMENKLKAETGRGGRLMTADEILTKAGNSFIGAMPGGFGFGFMGVPMHAFSATTGLTLNIQRRVEDQQRYTEEARYTILGANFLAGIQRIVGDSKLNGENDTQGQELQRKIIRNMAEGSGFEMVYIDTASVLETENGQEQLEKIAKAAGMDEAALQAAVQNGNFSVPIESFAQAQADNSVLTSISFSEHEDSIAEMERNAKDVIRRNQEDLQRAKEDIEKIKNIIATQYFPNDAEAATEALIAMYDNPTNPAAGLREIEKNLKEAKGFLLQPALDRLNQGFGNGVDIVTDDEGRGVRVSNNEQWYQDWYAKNQRNITKADLEELAEALMTGANNAPDIEGWRLNEAEYNAAADLREQLQDINKELDIVSRTKEKLAGLSAAEVQNAIGLTPEAFSVYRTIKEDLEKGPGTSSRAARLNAIIFARHADRFAERYTKASGRKFTAVDYYNRVKVAFDGTQAGGFAQMAGVKAANAPLGKLEQAKAMLQEGKTADEVWQATGWMQGEDGKWRFEIKDDLESIDVSELVENPGLGVNLSEIYVNPKLYAAYPWLRSIPVMQRESKGNEVGSVGKGEVSSDAGKKVTDIIFLSPAQVKKMHAGDLQAKSTLVHEIQHLIQQHEGFAAGGSSESAYRQIDNRRAVLNRLLTAGVIAKENAVSDFFDLLAEREKLMKESNEALFDQDAEKAQKAADKATAIEPKIQELNPEMSLEEILSTYAEMQNLKEILEAIDKMPPAMRQEQLFEVYRNLAGEQEARETQRRAVDWTQTKNAKLDYDKKLYGIEQEINNLPEFEKAFEVLSKLEKESLAVRHERLQQQMFIDINQDSLDSYSKRDFTKLPETVREFAEKSKQDAEEKLQEAKEELAKLQPDAEYQKAYEDLEKLPAETQAKVKEYLDTQLEKYIQTEALSDVNEIPVVHDSDAIVVFGGQEFGAAEETGDNFVSRVNEWLEGRDGQENTDNLNTDAIVMNDAENRNVNQLIPINVSTGIITATEDKSVISNAVSYFGNKYPNGAIAKTKIGDVHISRRGIRASIGGHFMYPAKIDAVPTIKEGLEKSIYLGWLNDFDGKNIKNHYFVYSIRLNNEEKHRYAVCRIREQYKEKNFYFHEIYLVDDVEDEIKKISGPLHAKPQQVKPDVQLRGTTLFKRILARHILKVNKESFDQRAWNGGASDFNAFDLGAVGSGTTLTSEGWGLYFTKNKKIAGRYAFITAMKRHTEFIDRELTKNAINDMVIKINGHAYSITEKIDDMYGEPTIYLNDNGEGILSDYEEWSIEQQAAREIALNGGIDKAVAALKKRLNGEGNFPGNANDTYIEQLTADKDIPAVIEFLESNESRIVLEQANNQANIDKLKEILPYLNEDGGVTYEAEIPESDVLLQGDVSLKEQPQKVAEGIKGAIAEVAKTKNIKLNPSDSITGSQLYGIFESVLGTQRAASELLNRHGIKGKEYTNDDDGHAFVIFDDKAISIINKFNQDINNKTKGSTTPMSDGSRLIQLFETADESTFLHEMGHLFLLDLEELAGIDAESAEEFAKVREWAEWHKGDYKKYADTPWAKEFADKEQAIIDAEKVGDYAEADRQKRIWMHERFARGFEIYLKDGKAPSKGLRAVFRSFAKFLRQVYAAFKGDGARASEDVERIMGRMIATDQEIEAMALDDQYKDIEKAGGEKLLNETEKETYTRWLEEAKEEACEKLMKIVMQDIKDQQQAKYEGVMQQMEDKYRREHEQDPIHLARAAIQSMGGDKQGALVAYPSIEEFEKDDAALPTLDAEIEEMKQKWNTWYEEEYLKKQLSEEAVREAMESSAYYHKAHELLAAAMARKLDLKNKINSKVEQAMQGIQDALDALPEQYDLQNDKTADPVKAVVEEINHLRFSTKWNAKDFAAIEKMIKAATREELRQRLKEFEDNLKQQKVDIKAVERANEGRMKLYAQIAADAISKQEIFNATNVNEHRRNQRKAEAMVKRMIKAGNIQMAIQQQQTAALSAAMAKEAAKAREKVEKLVSGINRQLNAKSVKLPARERYWHRHLAYQLRIGMAKDVDKPVLKNGQEIGNLQQLIQGYKDRLDLVEDYDVDSLVEIIDRADKQAGYKTMTVREFERVAELLGMIYKCGKDEFSLKTIAGKSIDEAVTEIIAETSLADNMPGITRRRIQDNTGGLGWNDWAAHIPVVGEGVAKLGQDYLSVTMKPEKLIELLGKKAHAYMYGTYDKAVNEEAEKMAKAVEDVQKILAGYSHSDRQAWKDIKYEIVLPTKDGGTETARCSKENIICMALNLGTEANRQRLTGGFYGVEMGESEEIRARNASLHTRNMEQFCAQHMTEQDWQLVQDIWDYLDTYWADTARVEEELNGMHLEKQKAVPFAIVTPDGKKIDMKGGYYPIVFNRDKDIDSAAHAQDDIAKQQGGSQKVLGMGRSHVKSRSENDVFRELQLTFDTIPNHLQQVIHNITTRLAARDVYRLINNAKLKDYIESRMGAPYVKILNDWSLDVWRQTPEKDLAANVVKKMIGALRRNSVYAIMAYRVWPALENFSNIGPVADRLGWMNALGAVTEFYANMSDFGKMLDKSVLMRNRINNMDRDIRSQAGLFTADNKIMETIREHGYDLMTYSDLMFSAPLWCRAFKQNYMDTYQEVMAENIANKKKQQEAQDKLDKLRGNLIDAKKDINDWHAEKRNRARAGQVGWQQGTSRFAVMRRGEFEVMLPELIAKQEELSRSLWEAEAEQGRAAEIKIFEGEALIKEVERRAVAKADAAVRDAFGSGRTVDLAAVSRSTSELTKIMTTFYSFFNTQFNAIYFKYLEGKHGANKDAGTWENMQAWLPFAQAVMNRIVVTSLIGSLLKMATKTDGDSDRDKWRKVKKDGKVVKEEIPWLERFLKVFGRNTLSMGMGAFYGVRDIGNLVISMAFDGSYYGRGINIASAPVRSLEEGIRMIQLICSKSARDAEIDEKEAAEQEKLRKMKPRQRAKYLENKKYKKPRYHITYAEILRHGANMATGLTAATTGVSSTLIDAVTGTMQYMLDTENRYDANWRNLIWSAIFDKRPVEREIPQKPEQPKKRKKKK